MIRLVGPASIRGRGRGEPGLRPRPSSKHWPGLVLIVLLVGAAPAGAQEVGSLRDPGREQHDPRYEPRNDPDSPLFQLNYIAADDPLHPLRGEDDPGSEWDNTGASNYVGPDGELRQGRGDGAPHIRSAGGNWNWGELYYSQAYPAGIPIQNNCDMQEIVTITVVDLPYIQLPRLVLVPARSTINVEFTITTPPPPNFAGLVASGGLGAWPGFLDLQRTDLTHPPTPLTTSARMSILPEAPESEPKGPLECLSLARERERERGRDGCFARMITDRSAPRDGAFRAA